MLAARDSGLLGNLADGGGIVAGDDLHGDPLLGKVGKGFLGVGAQLAGEQDEGDGGDQAAVQPAGIQGSAVLGAQQNPVALLGPAVNAPGILPGTQQKFRGAHNHAAEIREFTAIPFGFRGEGDPFGAGQAALPGEQLAHSPGGGVVRGHLAVHGGKDVLQLLRQQIPQGDQVFHHHIRLGNGTGFVHAQHIHPGKGFDAVHILHQNPGLAELLGGNRQSHAGQQIQTLGNHADEGGHGALRAFLKAQVQNPVFLVEENAAHRHQRQTQEQDQPVQRADHFRFFAPGILFRLPGQHGRAAGFAHGGELHPAPAGEHNASRVNQVAGALFHTVLFAGEEGFVYIKFSGAENTVGADLIALGELHNIIPDDAVGLRAEKLSAPNHRYRPPGHQTELFHRPLGTDFLDNADDGIDHHHSQKAQVFRRGASQQQKHRQNHKDQVEEGQAVPQHNFFFTGTGAGIGAAVKPGIQPLLNLNLGQTRLGVRVEPFCFFRHGIPPY